MLASLMLPVMVASPATATHVEPVEFPDNPTCSTLAPGTIELKVEPVADGTYSDGTLTVTIDVRDTADGQVFDFTSNLGLDAVFAKGSNTGNLYSYDPEETEDTGLHAPVNASGDFAGLSHISFCYDLEADIKVNKTIPNVVTGTETITVTFVAVLVGGDPTDPADIEGTCSITFTAGQTSGSCTITGLDPNTMYDIYETVTGGFDPQPSQTVTTGAGGSIKEVSFTNTFDNATATALKVTVPNATDAEGWTFKLFLDNAPAGAGAEDTLVATDLTDATGLAEFGELVAEGNYYITEVNQAGWTSDGGVNCTFTVDYPVDAGKVFDDCVITNTRLANAEVVKVTIPAGSEPGFEFTLFADDDETAGPSAGDSVVGGPIVSVDDQPLNFGVDLDEGDYYILETDGPAGFESNGGDAGCVFTVDFPADAGLTFTCTWTNTQQGTITIAKTVSGAASTETFTFELREGADDNDPLDPTDDSAGTLLGTETITADGVAVQLDGFLTPGTYQVCELLPGPGWMSTLGGAGQFILVINDSNERVCTDVVVGAGQDVAVTADNTPPPGGAQLTIGFWKTHSCQAPGNQENVLGEVLATFSGGGFLTGDLFVDTCDEAVSLLDKRAIDTGKKMASDPAYNLAAQYVAAKLNVQGGAGTCPDATLAIAQAQALLDAINFTGTGSYKNMTPTQKTTANDLANTLDQYNNGLLC
jgi:hypothetical protein